jgi:hypothetical protein
MNNMPNKPDHPSPKCTLDTEKKVEAVVIAEIQVHFPKKKVTAGTKIDDDLGLDPEGAATLLPGWMIQATHDGGCETRLGSESYRSMEMVQDIIDAIWADLKDKCKL